MARTQVAPILTISGRPRTQPGDDLQPPERERLSGRSTRSSGACTSPPATARRPSSGERHQDRRRPCSASIPGSSTWRRSGVSTTGSCARSPSCTWARNASYGVPTHAQIARFAQVATTPEKIARVFGGRPGLSGAPGRRRPPGAVRRQCPAARLQGDPAGVSRAGRPMGVSGLRARPRLGRGRAGPARHDDMAREGASRHTLPARQGHPHPVPLTPGVTRGPRSDPVRGAPASRSAPLRSAQAPPPLENALRNTAFGLPTPVTSSQPGPVVRLESWSNVRTL